MSLSQAKNIFMPTNFNSIVRILADVRLSWFWAIPKKNPPPPPMDNLSKIWNPKKKDQSADAHTLSEIGKFLPLIPLRKKR
jgi:hypothetical protein